MRTALAALLLVAGTASAEVTVRVTDGRVDVEATAAPLSDVLDRLARQTGMKVVYEGPVPRPLVSLSLERRTQAQAVLGILEGLGLNYAVQFDPTGTRVQTLLMAGAASPSSASRSAAPAPIQRTVSPPISSPDQVEEEEPLDDMEDEEPPAQPPPIVPPPGPVGLPTPLPSPTVPGATPFPGFGMPGYGTPFAPNPFAPFPTASPSPGGPTVPPPGPVPQVSPSPQSESK